MLVSQKTKPTLAMVDNIVFFEFESGFRNAIHGEFLEVVWILESKNEAGTQNSRMLAIVSYCLKEIMESTSSGEHLLIDKGDFNNDTEERREWEIKEVGGGLSSCNIEASFTSNKQFVSEVEWITRKILRDSNQRRRNEALLAENRAKAKKVRNQQSRVKETMPMINNTEPQNLLQDHNANHLNNRLVVDQDATEQTDPTKKLLLIQKYNRMLRAPCHGLLQKYFKRRIRVMNCHLPNHWGHPHLRSVLQRLEQTRPRWCVKQITSIKSFKIAHSSHPKCSQPWIEPTRITIEERVDENKRKDRLSQPIGRRMPWLWSIDVIHDVETQICSLMTLVTVQ